MSKELLKDSRVTITRSKGKYKENNGKTVLDPTEVAEGGWGYVIIFAFSIIQILMLGPLNSFGILFNDFLHEHGGGQHSVVIFITSMNMGIAISGVGSFMTSIALKRFTIRQTALFGLLVILFGDLFAVFMTKPYHLIITYGILRGFGLGVLFCLGFLVLNGYFVQKRTSMTSLAQTSACLGGIILPTVITALLEHYGFKGCMLIILGLDLHMLLAVILLVPARPIKRSLKVEIVRRCDIESNTNEENIKSLKMLLSKNASKSGIFETNNSKNKMDELKASIGSRIVKFFNLDFLTDPIFVNISFGLALSYFADANFKIIEPLMLYSYQLEKSQVAICITAGAVADFLSRILMAIITLYIKTSPRVLYFVALSLSFIMRLVFLISTDFVFLTIMTAVIGLVRSWIGVLFSVIIANYVSQDKFPAAYGLVFMITGITMLIGGPLTGMIHTITGSYVYVIYVLSFCNFINIITWIIEYFHTRNNKRNKI